jgi:hypothetical protein
VLPGPKQKPDGSQQRDGEHVLPVQHGWPTPPQLPLQPPSRSQVPVVVLHEPSRHALPSQQGRPAPPHCWHMPPTHLVSVSAHVAFAQQGCAAPPHPHAGRLVFPLHVEVPSLHVAFRAMHVCDPGSQHWPLLQPSPSIVPVQHG